MWNRKFKYTALWAIVLLHAFFFKLNAQNLNNYHAQFIDDQGKITLVKYNKTDSILFHKNLNSLITQKQEEGYLLINIDSVKKDSNTILYSFSTGRKFKNLQFSNASVVLEQINFKTSILEKTTPKKWIHFKNQSIKSDVDNGFPLSKIALQAIEIRQDSLLAQIDYQKGPFIKFGALEEKNEIVVSEKFLQRLLNIRLGAPFSYKRIQNMEATLSQLPYLETQYPPRISFNGEEASIYLYLKKRQSSSFDFLLGFNNKVNENSRSIQLTGQASFDLNNAFKIGERIYFHYENLQENSPRINFKLDFPYVSILPFGLGFDFNMHKFNEEFIQINTGIKLKKLVSQGEEFSLFVLNNYSYLLNIDSTFIKSNLKLPLSMDFNFTSYGVGYKKINTDYFVSPTRGFTVEIQASIGQKKYVKNSNILQYDNNRLLENQYDSLNRMNLQANLQAVASYYYSISKRQVCKLGLNSSYIFSKSKILQNEVFRIGGISSLRGFNDNLFASDGYLISTLEYRFLLDRNSYLVAFLDHGYMSVITQVENIPWQNYIGLGLGLQIQTQAGAFGLFFAVAKTEQTKFDFASSKVHFGYTARF